jgi:hypothetical protein
MKATEKAGDFKKENVPETSDGFKLEQDQSISSPISDDD